MVYSDKSDGVHSDMLNTFKITRWYAVDEIW